MGNHFKLNTLCDIVWCYNGLFSCKITIIFFMASFVTKWFWDLDSKHVNAFASLDLIINKAFFAHCKKCMAFARMEKI